MAIVRLKWASNAATGIHLMPGLSSPWLARLLRVDDITGDTRTADLALPAGASVTRTSQVRPGAGRGRTVAATGQVTVPPRHGRPTQRGTAGWGRGATPPPDGSVPVAGGSAHRSAGGTTAARSVERSDPGRSEWRPAAVMTDARTAQTALPLADDGVVLVVGGAQPVGAAGDQALAFRECYDVEHDRSQPTGTLPRGRMRSSRSPVPRRRLEQAPQTPASPRDRTQQHAVPVRMGARQEQSS
jgi:hypothetical protein